MHSTYQQVSQQRSRFGTVAQVLLAFALLLALLPVQNSGSQLWAQHKVQPILREMAASRPAQPVRVIVQRTGGEEIAAGATWQGGIVLGNLSIINALVMEPFGADR